MRELRYLQGATGADDFQRRDQGEWAANRQDNGRPACDEDSVT